MTTDTRLLPEEPIEELGTRLAEDGEVSEFLYIGESGLWRLQLHDGGWDEPALVAPEAGYDGYANYRRYGTSTILPSATRMRVCASFL